MRKSLSAPKFRLKGQGWYETDFKTGNKRNLHGDSESGGKSKDAKAKSENDKAASGSAAESPAKKTADSKASST